MRSRGPLLRLRFERRELPIEGRRRGAQPLDLRAISAQPLDLRARLGMHRLGARGQRGRGRSLLLEGLFEVRLCPGGGLDDALEPRAHLMREAIR
jgi:hypothetical protein